MTPSEITAYIGAAAWLPQIITWLYRFWMRPQVTVIPDKYAEVGFTSLGPIFNLRMVFTCEKKDAVIDGLDLLIRHENGDTRSFRWNGLSETFSEISDNAGNKQVISRNQTPIAIKIGTESIVEKFIRFQEPQYWQRNRPLTHKLITQFNYLKNLDSTSYINETLKSRELHETCEERKQSFWWQPGKHKIQVKLSSPHKINVKKCTWEFSLTTTDVDQLKANIPNLKIDLENIIKSNDSSFKEIPIAWNWANVDINNSADR